MKRKKENIQVITIKFEPWPTRSPQLNARHFPLSLSLASAARFLPTTSMHDDDR